MIKDTMRITKNIAEMYFFIGKMHLSFIVLMFLIVRNFLKLVLKDSYTINNEKAAKIGNNLLINMLVR